MFVFKIGCVIGNRQLKEAARLTLDNFPGQLVVDDVEIESWSGLLDKLERTQPDVILLDLPQVQESLEEAISRLKSIKSNPKVIIVHSGAEPDTILRCLRAGVDEFLFPPLETDLRSALDRMSAERLKSSSETRPRGKVLGFLSAKGGCGATSTACHVGVELNRVTKLEVLIADFDLERGIVGFLMKAKCRYSLVDALDNIQRLDTRFWKALVSNGIPGVEIIMAPEAGSNNARVYRDPEEYRNILRFARANYDWTVADLGSGLGYIAANVLEEIDSLYLVSTLEVPALHQAKAISMALLDKGYPSHRLHVVLNRMPKRSELTIEELEAIIGQPIYATLPNDYQSLNNAYSGGSMASTKTQIAYHYNRVAGKIAGINTRPKRRFSLF